MPLSSEIKELTEVGYKREPFLFSILILIIFVHCMTTPSITVLEIISVKHVGVPPCGDVCVNPPENPKRILPLHSFPPHLPILLSILSILFRLISTSQKPHRLVSSYL